jgi:DedD protein
MASAPPSALAVSDDATEIRRRAMRRLAIAVLMLTAAFGVLLTYERFKSPRMVAPDARPSPAATAAALKPPAEPPPEAAPAVEATPPEPAAPTTSEAPAAPPPPPPPQVINNERPPATGGPPPRLAPARPDTPAPKASAAAAPAPGAVARPAPATTAPPPASTTAPAPKPDTARGYAVQLGVFASPPNAEALQRKLAEAGLTTFTETRVLIGPFRDRAEADRSMEIVKKLGLAGVVVPARP